jgi:tyrosinase
MHLPVPAPGSGALEFSPHNNVHNDISGDMASGESPRDPVFWLHHSNLDRLWKRWLALGNARANPTTDNVWMTHIFTFFDENGTQVNLTGAQVLNTVSQLGYRYDDDPFVLWPLVKVKLAMAPQRRFQEPEVLAEVRELVRLGTSRVDTRVALTDRSRAALAASVADTSGDRLVLQLKDIHYDAPVGLSYLLFLDLPADAKQPDHTHPSFIGTLGFFGGSEHGDRAEKTAAGLTQEYDVTRVMRRLGAGRDLVVTAVPSLPVVPADRKDLQALRARLKPSGDPRFGEITLLRLKAQ